MTQPRILSLDKMLDDLRGAAAADSAKQGFVQGFNQGRVDAAAKEAAAIQQSKETGMAAGQEAAKEASNAKRSPTPTNYDEMAQAYFKTLADMEGSDQVPLPGPESSYGNDRDASPYSFKNTPSASAAALSPSTTARGRVSPHLQRPDLADLDAAQLSQGGSVMLPGKMPSGGGAPPPAGPPDGWSPEDYAILAAAARGEGL